MAVNIATLSESFLVLIKYVCKTQSITNDTILKKYEDEIIYTASTYYREEFFKSYNDIKRRKLGFLKYESEIDDKFYINLVTLLSKSDIDYTIFFRELMWAADLAFEVNSNSAEEAFNIISIAFYNTRVVNGSLKDEWLLWLTNYLERIKVRYLFNI